MRNHLVLECITALVYSMSSNTRKNYLGLGSQVSYSVTKNLSEKMKTFYLLLLLISLVITVQAKLFLGIAEKNPSKHFIGNAKTNISR
jgi:hypothetical protein